MKVKSLCVYLVFSVISFRISELVSFHHFSWAKITQQDSFLFLSSAIELLHNAKLLVPINSSPDLISITQYNEICHNYTLAKICPLSPCHQADSDKHFPWSRTLKNKFTCLVYLICNWHVLNRSTNEPAICLKIYKTCSQPPT